MSGEGYFEVGEAGVMQVTKWFCDRCRRDMPCSETLTVRVGSQGLRELFTTQLCNSCVQLLNIKLAELAREFAPRG